MAFSAASRRWRNRMMSSGGFIQDASLGGDLVAEESTQIARSPQIYRSAEQSLQLQLELCDAK